MQVSSVNTQSTSGCCCQIEKKPSWMWLVLAIIAAGATVAIVYGLLQVPQVGSLAHPANITLMAGGSVITVIFLTLFGYRCYKKTDAKDVLEKPEVKDAAEAKKKLDQNYEKLTQILSKPIPGYTTHLATCSSQELEELDKKVMQYHEELTAAGFAMQSASIEANLISSDTIYQAKIQEVKKRAEETQRFLKTIHAAHKNVIQKEGKTREQEHQARRKKSEEEAKNRTAALEKQQKDAIAIATTLKDLTAAEAKKTLEQS